MRRPRIGRPPDARRRTARSNRVRRVISRRRPARHWRWPARSNRMCRIWWIENRWRYCRRRFTRRYRMRRMMAPFRRPGDGMSRKDRGIVDGRHRDVAATGRRIDRTAADLGEIDLADEHSIEHGHVMTSGFAYAGRERVVRLYDARTCNFITERLKRQGWLP